MCDAFMIRCVEVFENMNALLSDELRDQTKHYLLELPTKFNGMNGGGGE